ncbi:type II secretion system protein GspC [Agaribacterium haliotis]|uniref:type II secretion system protein GspC n=1 Tax=Agaribacterium haliotis TaxID=2013869 RepID=UPI000BB58389|nr:type II secretion system protein GspC [Agaribacterium haliotis]
MAAQAVLTNLEQQAQVLVERLKTLPVDFWRVSLMVLALIWACHSAANLFWLLFPAPELASPPKVALAPSVDVGGNESYSVDLDALQEQELFGKAEALAPAAQAVPAVAAPDIGEDFAKTKLNLKLVGVFASSNAQLSSAIIAQGAKQKIYQLGDKLPAGNNVKLAKVMNDRVILDNNGNYEALWLYSDADLALKAHYAPAANPVPQQQSRRAPSPEFSAKIKPSQVPEKISDVVRFSVHREEGRMVGFRIRPGKDRELFSQLGLQANDVVTSVNGIPIDNAQAIRDNYQQLKSATSADLEVKRGEETLYINVSLDTTSE